ncbi:MAG: hypothetical protein QM733_06560 [Ilumatobacteraceae bacterium]
MHSRRKAHRAAVVAGALCIGLVARPWTASAVPIGTIGGGATASAAAVRLAPPTTTPAATTPAAGGGSSPTFAGCSVFPSTNAFNTAISSLAVRPESSTVVAATSASGSNLQFQFWSKPTSGFQVVAVPADQPNVPITYDQYPSESDPGPFPIPLDAPQEDNADKHIIVVQQGTCQLYELWATHRSSNGWYAGTGAQWDLASNATRPPRWTSADAAGLPIFPGLLRYDEVASGHIDHALRVTVAVSRWAVIAPATHFVGSANTSLLPMGARLRLRADYDISGFTGQSKVIAQALKTYGLIVADNGPNWMISGVGDARWDDTDMNQIRNIQASALEYVDNGPVVTG